MFPSDQSSNESIRLILLENQRLLIENNQMLHQMRKSARRAFLLRIIWLIFVLVASWYAYTEYIKPNVVLMQEKLDLLEEVTGKSAVDTEELKSSYESFKDRIKQEWQRLEISN